MPFMCDGHQQLLSHPTPLGQWGLCQHWYWDVLWYCFPWWAYPWRTLSLQREGGCCGLCAEVIILMSDWSESTLFGVRQRLSALSARLWAILLWWTLEIGKLSQQVVFVVGHQRSATSVMGYWSRMVNRESKCRISSTIWNQWFYHRNNIRHNLTTDMKTCFLESTSFTKR